MGDFEQKENSLTDNMRVTQCLKFLASSRKFSDFLRKQLVNSLHSHRVFFQLSIVHNAQGTSVKFRPYHEILRLVGEGGWT